MYLLIREADMGAAHSTGLRARVVAEVAAGSSPRGAAARFKVSAASAIRWVELEAQTGGIDPRPRGGKSRSPLEPHADWLKGLVAKEPDLTLAAIEVRLFEVLGLKVGETSIRRFFRRHALSYKKTLHASEQTRPDVAEARERWKAGQVSLDPRKLVFVDETGTNTKMVRAYRSRRCGGCERCCCRLPSPRRPLHRGIWFPDFPGGDDSLSAPAQPRGRQASGLPESFNPADPPSLAPTTRPKPDRNSPTTHASRPRKSPATVSMLLQNHGQHPPGPMFL